MTDGRSILVVGSSNMDLVVKINQFPLPGETLLGGDFFMNNGGKGANQAIAVSRLGGDVQFVCKTGRDAFRDKTVSLFKEEGIDTRGMLVDEEKPSGVAVIMVDKSGENSIVVAPGANSSLCVSDIDNLDIKWEFVDFVLLQLEIPIETVAHIVNLASEKGKKVILNPAPAADLPEDLFRKLHIITPNKIEAESISGVKITDNESLVKAAEVLHGLGVEHVIITLGSEGVLLYSGTPKWIPAIPTISVDSTGAGDVFNAALTVSLSEGKDFEEAIRFANKAASISITRFGAIPSIPHRKEIS
ncbi:MAG: ribokinase [Bacteroidetes bacterium]|nr:MAG: ribokinase [Bacteroidota bacterium]